MSKCRTSENKTKELPRTEAGGCRLRYFGHGKTSKDTKGNITITIKKD